MNIETCHRILRTVQDSDYVLCVCFSDFVSAFVFVFVKLSLCCILCNLVRGVLQAGCARQEVLVGE